LYLLGRPEPFFFILIPYSLSARELNEDSISVGNHKGKIASQVIHMLDDPLHQKTWRFFRFLSNALAKRWGLFLNCCGRTVQVSCYFLEKEFSHLKAKRYWKTGCRE
jgi:hypothetical protein